MLNPGVLIRRVRQIDSPDPVGLAFVSMSCNHCDDPVCVANCPVGAYAKQEDTGLVIQDHSLCIGCRTCIEVCPFSAPAYDEASSQTYKCDGCISRQQAGSQPVCTLTCPSMNISLDEFGSLLSSFPEAASLKEGVVTKPNYAATLDPDLTIGLLEDLDGTAGTVDRGGEAY
jgi:Fe-S-cluster-containing dehydrogenase component